MANTLHGAYNTLGPYLYPRWKEAAEVERKARLKADPSNAEFKRMEIEIAPKSKRWDLALKRWSVYEIKGRAFE